MRFFTDDSGRRPSAVWTWRSTTVVVSLALVSSLAVGLGAAGGLSVLDETGIPLPDSPPLADSRQPAPLPLDSDPPPPPNTADVADPEPEAEPPAETAPEVPETAEARQEEPVRAEPVPERDTEAGDSAVDPVEGTWTTVDQTVEGTWNAVGGTIESVPADQVFGWPEQYCPESDRPSWEPEAAPEADGNPSESAWYPSWDTEYPVHGGYER